MKDKEKQSIRLKKRVFEEILSELRENASFDECCRSALGSIIKIKEQMGNSDTVVVGKEALVALSTVRNKRLITADEQNRLRDGVVAFFGLSVGSHAAATWVMQARPKNIKLSDPDNVSPSNLNRLRYGWDSVGKLKVEVVEKLVSDMNPGIRVQKLISFNTSDISKFLLKSPKVDIIVDEVDNLEVKVSLREFAAKHRVPLISATDVGDNVILDIERYDLVPQPESFLGRLGGDINSLNISMLSVDQRQKLIFKLIGFKSNSEAMLESLLVIGKEIITWPQLGATATISGGILATALKKILTGENVKSGRFYLSLDDLIVSDFNNQARKKKRNKLISLLKNKLSNVG